MKSSELIDQYFWLMNEIVRAGEQGITLEDINKDRKLHYFRGEAGEPYARRTFVNHLEDIRNIFNINIECDRSNNRYRVVSGGDFDDLGKSTKWMINAFSVNNSLVSGREILSGRVDMEDVPSGQDYLVPLMNAMRHNNIVKFRYVKFRHPAGEDETIQPEFKKVSPYALKEADRRWYLVGFNHERLEVRVYGLDRISDLLITDEQYVMPKDFNVYDEFYESFGPYLADKDSKSVTVRFKARNSAAGYVRTLPLHATQTEVGDGEFTIRVRPNRRLVMEFCKYGADLEILEPEELRTQVRDAMAKALQQYEK